MTWYWEIIGWTLTVAGGLVLLCAAVILVGAVFLLIKHYFTSPYEYAVMLAGIYQQDYGRPMPKDQFDELLNELRLKMRRY